MIQAVFCVFLELGFLQLLSFERQSDGKVFFAT